MGADAAYHICLLDAPLPGLSLCPSPSLPLPRTTRAVVVDLALLVVISLASCSHFVELLIAVILLALPGSLVASSRSCCGRSYRAS